MPLVANSDIQLGLVDTGYVGVNSIAEKGRQFSQLSNAVSAEWQIDSDAFLELMANLLYIGLMTIPRCRFAAATALPPKRIKTQNFAQLFGCNNLNQWAKTSMSLAKRWHLPARCQAAMKAFFEIQKTSTSYAELPQSTAKLVATLQLAAFIFVQFSAGHTQVQHTDSVTAELKVIGCSAGEFARLYRTLIDRVRPTTSLS
jgi:hypothetical protein